jgi:membrane peptidoglycan carboxypeptidase
MSSFFITSTPEDPEYEATAGWYIAPEEELAAPPIAARSRAQQWVHHHAVALKYVVLPLLVVVLIGVELRTSVGQAVLLSSWAATLSHEVEPGPSSRIRFPEHGPYNERLGYSQLPVMADRLTDRGYEVAAQSRMSIPMALTMDAGLYPVYQHKDQAGLELQDHRQRDLYEVRYPGRAYTHPDSIPDLVWKSLLYIENRELLDRSQAYKNPAVEWDRFALAAFQRLASGGEGPGGSTLATQLTKVRHSPGGRTTSVPEKLRQMTSASLMAYRDGLSTLDQRRHLVKEYLNQLPLAATANHGEVNGLGDGLRAWYGSDFDAVNTVLTPVPADSAISTEKLERRAVAYRQVLSLLLSTRSPTRYLVREDGPAALAELTDHYLPLLAEAGIIDERLGRVAQRTDVEVLRRAPDRPATSYVTQKAANSVRIGLLRDLGLTNLPALDRLDLTVETTFDRDVQQAVADVLNDLEDPAYLRQHGLLPLIGEADPADIHYSVVLFERQPQANVLRLQADNVDGPFDVNQGSMLELGSTAKVRVLVTYLELVERLYRTHGDKAPEALAALIAAEGDGITDWTVNYLIDHPDASLRAVLEAAVERRISGDPAERFFTGGGVHVFQNYKPESNRTMTIREAAQESANLVFVRLMEDVLRYHIARLPGQVYEMLDDPTNTRRADYLERFALHEGSLFLGRYLRAYQDDARAHVLDVLGRRHELAARQFAWAYRSVFPQGSREAFGRYLRTYATDADGLTADRVRKLYLDSNPSGISWQDRGYLAGIHPLELWLVGYLHTHPAADSREVMNASETVRQEVYDWLFTNSKRTQDPRILTILEQEAFTEIHRMWTRLGYPFGRLVPTLATALGSSADRPAALAELMGILLRDGQRFPTLTVDSLHFATGTPYHTSLGRTVPAPTRVLSPALSRVARGVLRDVVEQGTAIRARGAVPGPDGQALVLGGKTGTGDNRVYSTGPGGTRTSVATSRTSTFVFYAGDRFFGTIVAYVEGPEADDHEFTSSLTTGILKVIGPKLAPLLDAAAAPRPSFWAPRTLSPAAGIGR